MAYIFLVKLPDKIIEWNSLLTPDKHKDNFNKILDKKNKQKNSEIVMLALQKSGMWQTGIPTEIFGSIFLSYL